jgi:ssDNA-binding Zn-finger/Zn-ribbon topoisomerase 1
MKLRTKYSGEKEGYRFWVCTRYPECRGQKSIAEEGKATEFKYHLEEGKFTIKGQTK